MDGYKSGLSWQDVFIKTILSRPFKIPMKDYSGWFQMKVSTKVSSYLSNLTSGPTLGGRALGVKMGGMVQALHDPDEDNALVLYYPPPQTFHEQMKLSK